MICGSPVVYVDLDTISFDKIIDSDMVYVVNKHGFIRCKKGYLHDILLGEEY